MVWAPRMVALRPEAQTLLTVVATTPSERPAPMAHWRAGAWPRLETSRGVLVFWTAFEGLTRQRHCRRGQGLLCGEDIAVEDLLDIFGLDLGDAFDGSWDEGQQLVSGAGMVYAGMQGCRDIPLMAWEPSWMALRLERELYIREERR